MLEFITTPMLQFLSGKFSCVLYSVAFVGLSTVSEPLLVTQYSNWAVGWKIGESEVDFPPLQSIHCGSGSTNPVYCSDFFFY